MGSGRTELANDEIVININGFGPLEEKDAAHISAVGLVLPYKAQYGNLCLGFRIKDQGWVWHFNSVKPVGDEATQKGKVKIEVNESNVDAIGILFEEDTFIEKISYTVSPER